MNKEYIYINGKVIVEDENGEKKVVDYSDKIDKILIKENLIEEIEKRLEETNSEIKDKEKMVKRNKIGRFSILISMLIVITFMPLFCKLLIGDAASMPFGQVSSSVLAEILGNMSLGMVLTIPAGIFGLSMAGIITLANCSNYRELKRELKGLSNEKNELEKNLVIEKNELEELNKNKQNKIENNEFIVKKVDDKDIIEGLDLYLQLYYDCGYNEDVYKKYYNNGTLHKKLRKFYSGTGIEEIEDYLVENKKVKRKTLKK